MSSNHSVHSHHMIHAIVEVSNQVSEKVESGLKVTRAISASEAFRKFNWLKNVPVRNVPGNFRGMVVSKNWAATFHFAEDILKPVEKITVVAALAENILHSHHRIQAILGSNDSWDRKGAQVSAQVSSIALRTLGGAIPAGTHVVALSLQGYCQIAGLAGIQGAGGLINRLKSLDAVVNSKFLKITDGDNIHLFIENHLVIK